MSQLTPRPTATLSVSLSSLWRSEWEADSAKSLTILIFARCLRSLSSTPIELAQINAAGIHSIYIPIIFTTKLGSLLIISPTPAESILNFTYGWRLNLEIVSIYHSHWLRYQEMAQQQLSLHTQQILAKNASLLWWRRGDIVVLRAVYRLSLIHI